MQTLYPKSEADLIRIFEVAKASGLTLSWGNRADPAFNPALVPASSSNSKRLRFDSTKYLNQVLAFDATKRLIMVQPGVKLAQLNDFVRPHEMYLPICLPSAMASTDHTVGNLIHTNFKGSNFLQHGRIVHYVAAIDAVMADAALVRFSTFGDGGDMAVTSANMARLIPQLFIIAADYRKSIAAELGAYPWREYGYNLDIFDVSAQIVRLYNPNQSLNLAHLLVGSFGQLALPVRITLRLAPLPSVRADEAAKLGSHYELLQTQVAPKPEANITFSTQLMEAFGRVKQLFDPENRLNPIDAVSLGMKPE